MCACHQHTETCMLWSGDGQCTGSVVYEFVVDGQVGLYLCAGCALLVEQGIRERSIRWRGVLPTPESALLRTYEPQR